MNANLLTGGVNHFIPYLAMRHRMFTKVNKLLWLTVHSIIVGGRAPSSDIPSSVSGQPYTISLFYFILFLFYFYMKPLFIKRSYVKIPKISSCFLVSNIVVSDISFSSSVGKGSKREVRPHSSTRVDCVSYIGGGNGQVCYRSGSYELVRRRGPSRYILQVAALSPFGTHGYPCINGKNTRPAAWDPWSPIWEGEWGFPGEGGGGVDPFGTHGYPCINGMNTAQRLGIRGVPVGRGDRVFVGWGGGGSTIPSAPGAIGHPPVRDSIIPTEREP